MKKKNLAFTVELLGLFILLVLVITVITQVFVMSRSHSLEAKQLTEAVILAENSAEIASSEEDRDVLAEKFAAIDNLLNTEGTVFTEFYNEDNFVITYAVSFTEKSDSYYIIELSRNYDRSNPAGVLASDEIKVFPPVRAGISQADILAAKGDSEPVYSLSTARYFAGKEGE